MANEKRLIDANALLESFGEEPEVWSDTDAEIQARNDWHRYRVIVKCQPIVDAVEVVRCKDCKHWFEEIGWCTKHSHFIGVDGKACHPSQSSEWEKFNADDFCSYGERREGE